MRYTKKLPDHAIIVPDVSSYTREVSEYGIAGVILRRFWRLSLYNKLILVWRNIPFIFEFVRRDFTRGVMVLTEIELLSRATRPKMIFLAGRITDLVACFGVRHTYSAFASLARRYGYRAGLVTHNPQLIRRFIASSNQKGTGLTSLFASDRFLSPSTKNS